VRSLQCIKTSNFGRYAFESLKVFVPREKEDSPVMGGEWVSLREGLKGVEIGQGVIYIRS